MIRHFSKITFIKSSGTLLITFLFSSVALAQSIEDAYEKLRSNSNTVSIFTAPKSTPALKVMLIECPFGRADLSKINKAALPEAVVIEEIILVYTTYKQIAEFDQLSLNYRRLQNLYSLIPSALNTPFINWRMQGQTAAASPEEGRNLFHGFVILYRPAQSAQSIDMEIAWMDSIFGVGKKTTAGKVVSTDSKITSGGMEITGDRPMKMPLEFDTISLEKDTTIIFYEYFQNWKFKRVVTLKPSKVKGYLASRNTVAIPVKDTTVTAVLNRNEIWSKSVLVCDVTGSMSPYTAQVVEWLKQNSGSISFFLFFNDAHGPTKAMIDYRSTSSNDFKDIYNIMKQAMKGDRNPEIPENNITATLVALNRYPEAENVIMIADNYASPHDLARLNEVNRPVHIILCGSQGIVNPVYLDIARATRGSVHTFTEDMSGLEDVPPDGIIQLGTTRYQLRGGKFTILSWKTAK